MFKDFVRFGHVAFNPASISYVRVYDDRRETHLVFVNGAPVVFSGDDHAKIQVLLAGLGLPAEEAEVETPAAVVAE